MTVILEIRVAKEIKLMIAPDFYLEVSLWNGWQGNPSKVQQSYKTRVVMETETA